MIPESSYAYYKDVFRHIEKLCSIKFDGYLRLTDLERLPVKLRSTIQTMFARYAHDEQFEEGEAAGMEGRTMLNSASKLTGRKVLSLLDFVVAIYDLSAMLVLNKLLSSAFTLIGGSE